MFVVQEIRKLDAYPLTAIMVSENMQGASVAALATSRSFVE